MSKKLPKAIGRTIDDMRRSAAGARAEIVRSARDPASEPAASKPAADQPAVPPPEPAASSEPQSTLPAERANTLPVPVAPALPPAPLAEQHAEPDIASYKAMLRRARAREIIERHAKYAAVGGLIPLPIVDIAGVTAIIVRMARGLARLYEVPERSDRTRAIVLGLIGGTAPVGIGAVVSSSVMRFIPGVNVVGMAATSIAAAALTRSIGLIFLEHFESGRTLLDFKVERRAEH
jgi:uncharacterized protein (DUF697 family)